MTSSNNEHIKANWQQTQTHSRERLQRVRSIIAEAGQASFQEVKDGAAEVEQVTRKSLATVLQQWHQEHQEQPEGEPLTPQTSEEPGESEAPPSWERIFKQVLQLISQRKGVWSHQALIRLHQQLNRFDANMVDQYGDRYRRLQPIVSQLSRWVKAAADRLQQAEPPAPEATPVQVEILGDSH